MQMYPTTMEKTDTQIQKQKIRQFAEELEEALCEAGEVSELMRHAIVSAFMCGAMVGEGNYYAPTVMTAEIAKSAAFAGRMAQ